MTNQQFKTTAFWSTNDISKLVVYPFDGSVHAHVGEIIYY